MDRGLYQGCRAARLYPPRRAVCVLAVLVRERNLKPGSTLALSGALADPRLQETTRGRHGAARVEQDRNQAEITGCDRLDSFPIIDVTRACAQTLDNANPVEAVTPRGDRAQRLKSSILLAFVLAPPRAAR